jgi:hypothetical protein
MKKIIGWEIKTVNDPYVYQNNEKKRFTFIALSRKAFMSEICVIS